MTTQPGTQVLVWAVEHPKAEKTVTTLSYKLLTTREEAIEDYCKLTGKTWSELEAEGAKLVQKSVAVYNTPGTGNRS
jgi:hypothetical protein